MKKIINGLLYDTEVSTIIYTEQINNRIWYKTNKNNYFVFYRTGAIIPKTEEEVKDFLGKNDVDKYIELFGEVDNA